MLTEQSPGRTSQFRDPERLAGLSRRIHQLMQGREYGFMHVCGTHEHVAHLWCTKCGH